MKKPIRIGIPSIHSRLHPKVMGILGFQPYADPKHLVFHMASVDLFLIRGWDLAKATEAGRLDIAFCGLDTIIELEPNVKVIKHFDHMKSPIGLCMRNGQQLKDTKHLVVATEYPITTRRYLEGRYPDIEIVHVHGATEAFGQLEGIHAIVDIVETRETLRCNDLYLAEEFFHTYPCLVVSKNAPETIQTITEKEITFYIKSVFPTQY